jgi:hypothetical protein
MSHVLPTIIQWSNVMSVTIALPVALMQGAALVN